MYLATLSYLKGTLRNLCLDFVFRVIGFLTDIRLSCKNEEDTAELTDNRRGLRVWFTFQGQSHVIVLPYNPYRLSRRRIIFRKDLSSDPIIDEVSSLPGLDDFLYNRETLEYIHDVTLGFLDLETSSEYDD